MGGLGEFVIKLYSKHILCFSTIPHEWGGGGGGGGGGGL